MRPALAMLLILALCTAALGHSWYDPACCSGEDCAPLPENAIEERADGYLLKSTGELIPREKGRQSQDENYHLCRSAHTNVIYCLYLPLRGV